MNSVMAGDLYILGIDSGGVGLDVEMPPAIQEIVMGLWLLIAGFNPEAVGALSKEIVG